MAITVAPSGDACGAQIHGVDLTAELSAATVAEIRAAWLEHLVVSFADQELSLDRFEDIAQLFGAFGVDPYLKGLADHPHVAEVKRLADETAPIFAEAWHSDWSFLAEPPSGTLLLSRVIPPIGGNTLYANQHAAYDALAEPMKQRLDGLLGIHSARRGYSRQGSYGDADVGRSMAIISSDDAMATQTHPLVRVHPETGRKALFLSMGYTIGVEGLDNDDAQGLLVELYRHQSRPEFVYTHRWKPQMLTMWDNRALIHAATGGYQGHDRLLHRITVTGPG